MTPTPVPSAVFSLPSGLDYTATFFAGVSGALVAVRCKFDIVGVFFMAMLTALGGAFLRDGVFLGQVPSVVINDANFLLIISLSAGVSVCLRNRLHRLGRIISLVDAVSLAAYAILGAAKAAAAGIPVVGTMLIGVINAVGGGVMRDICAGEEPMIFRPGEFYALVAFFGTMLYVFFLRFTAIDAGLAAYLSMAAILVVRLLTIVLHWETKSFSTLYGQKK
jgi:uncharacterized membrane protein YeiH